MYRRTFMDIYLISVLKPSAVEVAEEHLFFLKFNIISLSQNVQYYGSGSKKRNIVFMVSL